MIVRITRAKVGHRQAPYKVKTPCRLRQGVFAFEQRTHLLALADKRMPIFCLPAMLRFVVF